MHSVVTVSRAHGCHGAAPENTRDLPGRRILRPQRMDIQLSHRQHLILTTLTALLPSNRRVAGVWRRAKMPLEEDEAGIQAVLTPEEKPPVHVVLVHLALVHKAEAGGGVAGGDQHRGEDDGGEQEAQAPKGS